MSVLVHITIDHEVIRQWAARTGARPATVEGDERAWPLYLDTGPPGTGVVEIGWDRFFGEFERAELAFIYAEDAPGGLPEDFYELMRRASVPELAISGKSTVIERVA